MVLLSYSAGVPQGSIFRPFCSVFINGIPNCTLMIQYYMNRGGETKLLKLLQHYGTLWIMLSHWVNDSHCTSNLKTVCMFFSHQLGERSVAVNGGSLDYVEDSKYLYLQISLK